MSVDHCDVTCNFLFSPWFHENTTKMDLSMKINIQHLFKVVLEEKDKNRVLTSRTIIINNT